MGLTLRGNATTCHWCNGTANFGFVITVESGGYAMEITEGRDRIILGRNDTNVDWRPVGESLPMCRDCARERGLKR